MPGSATRAPDLRAVARALGAAAGFLTRLPVPARLDVGHGDLAAGAVAFPLVGAALGTLVGGAALLLAHGLPALLAAALAVALEAALTGALHLDGLADSFDGLAGRGTERALAIMRDHAVGAYGACALVCDLLVKVVALTHLAGSADLPVVVAVYVLSRAAVLPLAAALPYARPGGGVGALLAGRLGWTGAVAGGIVACAGAGALAGVGALALIAAAAAVVVAVGLAARRRLGGVTGDVLGAAIELAATAGLVVAVALRA